MQLTYVVNLSRLNCAHMLSLQASNEMIVDDENLSHCKMKSRMIHRPKLQQQFIHVTPSFYAFQFPMNEFFQLLLSTFNSFIVRITLN